MNEKKIKPSKNTTKFSPLEMEDRCIDGDHNHDDFNCKPQLQIERSDAAILIVNDAATTTAVGGEIAVAADSHVHALGGDLKSAILGIVKGMVGPAILYLPHGFAQAGWVIAVPMLFASTALYLASSTALLECWKIETTNRRRILEQDGNGDSNGEYTHAVLEMKDLRKNNSSRNSVGDSIGGSSSAEEFDNEEGALIVHESSNTADIAPTMTAAHAAATTLSYPDLAKKAYGSRGQNLVKIGIAAMQSGVCLTYLIFVPQNMRSSCRALFGMDISTSFFLFLMVLVQIPLSWIREIRHLTVTNALANGLIMYGLITCLRFAFQNAIVPVPVTSEENGGEEGESDNGDGYDGDSERGPLAEILYKFFHLTPFNSSGWFLFIGTSVLLFEGSITLLIPLQEAVASPHDRQYFPKMYPNVILCIVWFYTFFGIFCWLSFGDDVHTVMTTSLPENSSLATTVQLAYSVAVMLTFPLQNFPSLEISCTAIASVLQKVSGSDRIRINNTVFRILQILQRRDVLSSLLVCLLALVAILTMDHLDKVVSLMGGLLGCPLAFVFPPLIHNKLASMAPESGSDDFSGKGSGGYQMSDRRRLQNKIVASLGFGAMIVATIATILKW